VVGVEHERHLVLPLLTDAVEVGDRAPAVRPAQPPVVGPELEPSESGARATASSVADRVDRVHTVADGVVLVGGRHGGLLVRAPRVVGVRVADGSSSSGEDELRPGAGGEGRCLRVDGMGQLHLELEDAGGGWELREGDRDAEDLGELGVPLRLVALQGRDHGLGTAERRSMAAASSSASRKASLIPCPVMASRW
jgi:hypothetical protein